MAAEDFAPGESGAQEHADQIPANSTPQDICDHLIRYYRLREIVQALFNAVVIEGVADPCFINQHLVGSQTEEDRRALSNRVRRERSEAALWARAALTLKRVLAELPDVGGREGDVGAWSGEQLCQSIRDRAACP
jgi:hypothetical protein